MKEPGANYTDYNELRRFAQQTLAVQNAYTINWPTVVTLAKGVLTLLDELRHQRFVDKIWHGKCGHVWDRSDENTDDCPRCAERTEHKQKLHDICEANRQWSTRALSFQKELEKCESKKKDLLLVIDNMSYDLEARQEKAEEHHRENVRLHADIERERDKHKEQMGSLLTDIEWTNAELRTWQKEARTLQSQRDTAERDLGRERAKHKKRMESLYRSANSELKDKEMPVTLSPADELSAWIQQGADIAERASARMKEKLADLGKES